MRVLLLCFAVFFSACASLPTSVNPSYESGAEIVLTQSLHGKWVMTANFDTPQSHLIFSDSPPYYREKNWKVLSPGVRLESVLGLDAVILDPPATSFQVAITPASGGVRMTRYPFYEFGDGSEMFLTNQFYMARAKDMESIRKLQGNIENWRGRFIKHTIEINAAQPVYINGDKIESGIHTDIDEAAKFAYIGNIPVTEHQNYKGVVDPNLPVWIKDRIDDDLGKIISTLEGLMGDSLSRKPTLFMLKGNERKYTFGYAGVAFPNLTLALRIEGTDIDSYSPKVSNSIMDFYAHEIGHLFQKTEKEVSKRAEKHAWIVEGSAEIMAYETIMKSGLADSEYVKDKIDESFKSCNIIAGGSLDVFKPSVRSRYYECGALIALMVDRTMPEDNIFSFWRALAQRADKKDGRYDTDLYFKVLRKKGVDPEYAERLETFVTNVIEAPGLFASEDNQELFQGLLIDAGLVAETNSDGTIKTLNWPM